MGLFLVGHPFSSSWTVFLGTYYLRVFYSLNQFYMVPPVAGPLATSLATTEYLMDHLLASQPWRIDPAAIPIPWRKELAALPTDRKLRLGVVFDDGVVRPQPPVMRAMRETVQALRDAGHEGLFLSPFSISFL